jgi:ribosomal-protein-alanine N-acetyltransferase
MDRLFEQEPVRLATRRLRIRPVRAGDAAAQFALHADPLAMRYWSCAAWTRFEQAERQIAQARQEAASGTALCLALLLGASNTVIGNVSLYAINRTHRRCELGYMLARSHHGQGLMAEAAHAVIGWAFGAGQLDRIGAEVDPRNIASERLLVNAGFTREGYAPRRWIVNNEHCDSILYGLLRDEWPSLAAGHG